MYNNEESYKENYKSVNISKYFNKSPFKKVILTYPTRFGIINSEGLGEVEFIDFGAGTLVEIYGCVFEGICDLDGEELYNTIVKINGYFYYHVGHYSYYG